MYIGSVEIIEIMEIMDHGDHLNLTHQQKRRPGGRGTYAQPGEHQTRRLEICEPVGKRTYVHIRTLLNTYEGCVRFNFLQLAKSWQRAFAKVGSR